MAVFSRQGVLQAWRLCRQSGASPVSFFDTGNETPEAKRLLGFFHAIFLK